MWCWLFTAQPALYGWYLADEPDGAGDVEGPPVGVQPETVQAAYDLVKELDPHHPVLLSLNCMHSAPYYQVRSDRRRRWGAVCCAASRSSLPSFSAPEWPFAVQMVQYRTTRQPNEPQSSPTRRLSISME